MIDAIDRIGVLVGVLFREESMVRGLARVKVDGEEYVNTLDELDKAVSFFGEETEYYRRALLLREAALDLWKESVVDRIKSSARDVADILDLANSPMQADKLEASLIY